MKILTVMFGLAEVGQIVTADAIRWKGKLWLVPEWLVSQSRGVRRPKRLVRFDQIPHQKIARGPKTMPADFVLNEPLPKAVLDGSASQLELARFEIVEMPALTFPLPRSSLN